SILTFILALTGRLIVKDKLTRQGPSGFAARGEHMGIGLVGRVLGSIGIGNIGAELFRLATPLDMRFIAHDPFADAKLADALGVQLVSLDDVFARADIVTVNCPLTAETRQLVNADRLALMKQTAFFINTARGPIDQKALTDVLASGRISDYPANDFAFPEVDQHAQAGGHIAFTRLAEVQSTRRPTQGVGPARGPEERPPPPRRRPPSP